MRKVTAQKRGRKEKGFSFRTRCEHCGKQWQSRASSEERAQIYHKKKGLCQRSLEQASMLKTKYGVFLNRSAQSIVDDDDNDDGGGGDADDDDDCAHDDQQHEVHDDVFDGCHEVHDDVFDGCHADEDSGDNWSDRHSVGHRVRTRADTAADDNNGECEGDDCSSSGFSSSAGSDEEEEENEDTHIRQHLNSRNEISCIQIANLEQRDYVWYDDTDTTDDERDVTVERCTVLSFEQFSRVILAQTVTGPGSQHLKGWMEMCSRKRKGNAKASSTWATRLPKCSQLQMSDMYKLYASFELTTHASVPDFNALKFQKFLEAYYAKESLVFNFNRQNGDEVCKDDVFAIYQLCMDRDLSIDDGSQVLNVFNGICLRKFGKPLPLPTFATMKSRCEQNLDVLFPLRTFSYP